jgi:hypothetical protein
MVYLLILPLSQAVIGLQQKCHRSTFWVLLPVKCTSFVVYCTSRNCLAVGKRFRIVGLHYPQRWWDVEASTSSIQSVNMMAVTSEFRACRPLPPKRFLLHQGLDAAGNIRSSRGGKISFGIEPATFRLNQLLYTTAIHCDGHIVFSLIKSARNTRRGYKQKRAFVRRYFSSCGIWPFTSNYDKIGSGYLAKV